MIFIMQSSQGKSVPMKTCVGKDAEKYIWEGVNEAHEPPKEAAAQRCSWEEMFRICAASL